MTEKKPPFDTSKLLVGVTTIFLAFLTWFGKVTYDKLLSIEKDVQLLLVSSGIDKTEIQNLKDMVNGKKPDKTVFYHIPTEYIVPDETYPKKRQIAKN